MPPEVIKPTVTEEVKPVVEETTPIEESIPSPPVVPIEDSKDRLLRMQQVTMQDAIRRANELEHRLNELSSKPVTETKPVPANEFFDNPETHTRRLIREELSEALKPLLREAGAMRAESAYDKLRRDVSADPRFSKLMSNPEFANYVDQAMSKVDPSNLNRMTMITAIGTLKSMAEFGELPIKLDEPTRPVTTPKPDDKTMVTPPHLRPSAQPIRTEDKSQKRRELTENEAKEARRNNMTADEYLDFVELPPDQVTTTKIGRKA